jgi:hypothetical protein
VNSGLILFSSGCEVGKEHSEESLLALKDPRTPVSRQGGLQNCFIRPDYKKKLTASIPQNQQSMTLQYTNHPPTDSCAWIQHANFDTLASSHYVQSITKIVTVPWISKEYFQDQMMQM